MERDNSFKYVKYEDDIFACYRNMSKDDAINLCSYIKMSTDEIYAFIDTTFGQRKIYCDYDSDLNTINYVIKLSDNALSTNKLLKGEVKFDNSKVTIRNNIYRESSDRTPQETIISMFELNLEKVKEDVVYDFNVDSMTKIEKRYYYQRDKQGKLKIETDREIETIYMPDKKYFYDVSLPSKIISEVDYNNSTFTVGNLNVEYKNFDGWSDAASILEFLNMSIGPTNGMLTNKLTEGNIVLEKNYEGAISFSGTFNDDIHHKKSQNKYAEGHITYIVDKTRARYGYGDNNLFITSSERNEFDSEKKEIYNGYVEQFSTQITGPSKLTLIHKYDIKRKIVKVLSDVKKYEVENKKLPNDVKKIFPSDFNSSDQLLTTPLEISAVKQLCLQKR